MPEPRSTPPLAHLGGAIHEIRWSEICPWLILIKALRVSLLVRVLMLGYVGALLTQMGWSSLSQRFSTDATNLSSLSREALAVEGLALPVRVTYDGRGVSPQVNPLVRGWFWVTKSFWAMADRDLSAGQLLRLLLCGIWAVVVWAVFGGAIARIAALYFTRGEILGPGAALRDAITVSMSTIGAPLIVLLAALALAVPLVLLGALLRLDVAALVVAVLWCFVLCWGFLLAVVLLGLMIAWPLMWACLGVERSDAFDAVSRGFAYVYQKPLHLAFYVVIAALLTYLGEAVVNIFTSAAILFADGTVGWGTGTMRADELLYTDWQNSSVPFATRWINGWKWVTQSLALAFPMACLWPFAVGIYLLQRSHIDGTELDEVTLSDGTRRYSLPREEEASGDQIPVTENSDNEETEH